MSIASPRPSITLSSRRTSIDTITSTTSKTTNSQAAERGSLRRNRTALRDYYNLKTSQPQLPSTSLDNNPLSPDLDSNLDKPDFNPSTYVQNLLATEDLFTILRTEAGLVSDIRNLDGEKKALVYDNYSKLITATDTIRLMREKMDPMMPGTTTLGPAIGHIAETAMGLKRELREGSGGGGDMERQKETVKWVLGSAERIGEMKRSGRSEEAMEELEKVEKVLDMWGGVKGVEEVRKACLRAFEPEGGD